MFERPSFFNCKKQGDKFADQQGCKALNVEDMRHRIVPALYSGGLSTRLNRGEWKLTCYSESPLPTLPVCSLETDQTLENG